MNGTNYTKADILREIEYLRKIESKHGGKRLRVKDWRMDGIGTTLPRLVVELIPTQPGCDVAVIESTTAI